MGFLCPLPVLVERKEAQFSESFAVLSLALALGVWAGSRPSGSLASALVELSLWLCLVNAVWAGEHLSLTCTWKSSVLSEFGDVWTGVLLSWRMSLHSGSAPVLLLEGVSFQLCHLGGNETITREMCPSGCFCVCKMVLRLELVKRARCLRLVSKAFSPAKLPFSLLP